MADSDDEDFVYLGTAFKQFEPDAPRKKAVPVHEQVVTDDRGRRRFHGAFTGGFSAGYFNTVDTKEGWTPSTFKSSRSRRDSSKNATQRPEDFMDEEDLGEFGIAPQRVITTEKFLSSDDRQRKRQYDQPCAVSDRQTADPLLQHLVVPVKMSIGNRLLTQMGWREGQGIGPRVRQNKKKVYGCSRPDDAEEEDIYAIGLMFAPKDVESVSYASKDNMHGIGYSGLNPRAALMSKQDLLGAGPSQPSRGVYGIRGQAFGTGVFEEEDDDVYAQDIMSNYDIPKNISAAKKASPRKDTLFGWTGPPQASDQGGLLSLFSAAKKAAPARKFYPPPVIPRDYHPFRKPDESEKPQKENSSVTLNQKSTRLTAEERGKILGEEALPTPKKSVFDYISKEDQSRIKSSKDAKEKTVTSNNSSESSMLSRAIPTVKLTSGSFKPFAKDPAKQERYERFLSGEITSTAPTGNALTEWEREREREEFARAAILYRPLNQAMASRFTSAKQSDELSFSDPVSEKVMDKSDQFKAAEKKMFGALTRERFQWHPDRVLCKRFNIPDPYPGSGVVGVPLTQQAGRGWRDKPESVQLKAILPTSASMGQKEASCAGHVDFVVEASLGEKVRSEKAGNDKEHQTSSTSGDTRACNAEPDADTSTGKSSALLSGFQSLAQRHKATEKAVDGIPGSSGAGKVGDSSQESGPVADSNVVQRPSMDIFKAIFAESSSDESEQSDSEHENTNESRSTVGPEPEQSRLSVIPEPKHEVITNFPRTSTIDIGESSVKESNELDNNAKQDGKSSILGLRTKDLESDAQRTDFDIPKIQFSLPSKTKKPSDTEAYGPALPQSSVPVSSKQCVNTITISKVSAERSDEDEYVERTVKKKSHKNKTRNKTDTDSSDVDTGRHVKRKEKKRKEKKRRREKDSNEKTRVSKSSKNFKAAESEKKKRKKKKKYRGHSSDYSTSDDSSDGERRERSTSRKDKKKNKKAQREYSDTSSGSEGESDSRDNRAKERASEKSKLSDKSRTSENTPDPKEIMNKLNNIRAFKEQRRMRASDFM
ncbi:G patch domain-containing protein 1 [Nematostella vectensis]|uniref:G patch domain-containing protein 1 n=1 Tax=Nematostella vectensis TaxID=45351 RepID=UPI0020774EC1|nr:G patch domain-containing protein 1 [Nematostella vectensis]